MTNEDGVPTNGHNLLQKNPPNTTVGRNGTVTSTMTVPSKKHSIFGSKRRTAVDEEASTRAVMGSTAASRANRIDVTDDHSPTTLHGGTALRGHRSSDSFSSDVSDTRLARAHPPTTATGAAIPPAIPLKDTHHNGTFVGDGPDGRISIEQAQTKLKLAIDAENSADQALELARRHVREAKELIARLETEANEEAERAHAKSALVAEITNSLKGLGRHG